MVFHKGSPLKDEVNRILDEMIQDGTYQEIYDSWFLLP
jgi:ABC-type amino acid transport substrate-binding protein